jgi:integrase
MRFHGLRDTCLSHMAVRGDDSLRVQWRAGHTQFAMTQKYIEEASGFRWDLASLFRPFRPKLSSLIGPPATIHPSKDS